MSTCRSSAHRVFKFQHLCGGTCSRPGGLWLIRERNYTTPGDGLDEARVVVFDIADADAHRASKSSHWKGRGPAARRQGRAVADRSADPVREKRTDPHGCPDRGYSCKHQGVGLDGCRAQLLMKE